jgi:putative ABC transport system permease protein
MLLVTIRNLMAKKGRILLTGLAVILGVAFFAGAQFTGGTFADYLANTAGIPYQKADLVVRGTQLSRQTSRSPVPLTDVAKLKAVSGVTEVQAEQTGNTQIVKRDGKLAATTYLGAVWIPETLNPQHLTTGRAPTAANDVVLDRQVAKDLKFALGDRIEIFLRTGTQEFTIVGLSTAGLATVPQGEPVPQVGFVEAQAKDLVQVKDSASLILVKTGGADPMTVLPAVSQAVQTNSIEATTAQAAIKDAQQQARNDANIVTVFLLVFALLALFVGMFIIYNTFSILVAQRTREMALLRAIGAYRKQVLRSVLVEGVLVGFIASVIGVAVGVGVATFLVGLFDIGVGVSISAGPIISGLVVGTVVTIASAYFPARRAAKIPPIAALRDVSVDTSGQSRKRLVIGVVLFVLGILELVNGLRSDAKAVGFSALLVIVSAIVLGPVLAVPFVKVIGAPVRWIKKFTGQLAEENALRNPKRTAATATALTIGVALVGCLLVLAASLKAGFNDTISREVKADYLVTPIGANGPQSDAVSLPPGVITAIDKLPGVEVATPSQTTLARPGANGDITAILSFDPAKAEAVYNFELKQGSISGLSIGDVAVNSKKASDDHLTIGSRIPFTLPLTGKTETLTVSALMDASPFGSQYVVSNATMQQLAPGSLDRLLWIKAPNLKIHDLKVALEPFVNANVTTPAIIKNQLNAIANQILAVMIGLLGLSIVIAIIGVGNTIALSIVERTRELGVLRAVGMSRVQLRSSIRWESTIVSVFGTILGLIIGVGFGISIMEALIANKVAIFTTLAIPYTQLILATVLAALAGAVAALLPAWRASHLNPLDAIRTE